MVLEVINLQPRLVLSILLLELLLTTSSVPCKTLFDHVVNMALFSDIAKDKTSDEGSTDDARDNTSGVGMCDDGEFGGDLEGVFEGLVETHES